jgi:ribose transport system ATP-binding protein
MALSNGQSPALLRMRGICKQYPGVQALNGADLEVRAGEVHVLLGENGAGKSTLMKVLSGAVRPDAGEILFEGRPADISDPVTARKLGIRTIYQELSLVPQLTVAENIFLGKTPVRWPGVVDWPRMRREAARVLAGLEVSVDPDSRVRELRLSQQQMVEVARALADAARILIMDEPTSALSEREVAQLFATIKRLTSSGVAVVYISHRMDEVFRIGDRVTVLRDGCHVATHDIGTASVSQLVRLMANRDISDHYPRRTPARTASHTTRTELLRVEGLSGGTLRDVSLTLHRGEIVGIAGLVGAGRSRLARAIAGADPITHGRITVKGTPVDIRSPADAVRAGIGFLPEDRKQQGLVLALSVEHNIAMSHLSALSRFGVINHASERREADKAIADLRIRTPGPTQIVLYLSGGNQQKVVLSKWLAGQADIFIFDEPTRGIDVAARHDIYLLMNALVENGAGVIMISSDLPEVLGMSDRILVMRAGAIQLEIPAADATDTRVLQAALGIA